MPRRRIASPSSLGRLHAPLPGRSLRCRPLALTRVSGTAYDPPSAAEAAGPGGRGDDERGDHRDPHRRRRARGDGPRRGSRASSSAGPRQRAGDLPRRPSPRRELRAGQLHPGVRARRKAHVRRARSADLVRPTHTQRRAAHRPGDPQDIPHQQRLGRLHHDRVGPLLRARRDSSGLARRSRSTGSHRWYRRPVLCALHGPHRRRGELVHVLLDGVPDGHRQGKQHRGAPAADRRQLPDRHSSTHVRGDESRSADPRQPQPGARRRDRSVDRRHRRLALGDHPARHPDGDRLTRRVCNA